ncbi:hypothetical protein chiPu_0002831 [Chiloscyllium punctatum]|uniref:Ion transport N-terminal domain-containing protein n=1 Tax=Chiloscyllium punctatum TaxID=137246 RepID=A0A401S243_CHIPU|nr:hypothetical protein [Chiloscyllium punctatum]
MSRNPEESVSTTKRVKLQGQDAGSIEDGESTESENAGTDGDGQTVEGESAGVDAGGQRLEGDNAEIDGKSQRVDRENADIDGGGQRVEGENADIGGSGQRVEGENAGIDGGGQRVEGENAGIDGGGQRVEGENADIDGSGQRVEGENAGIDGGGQRGEGENADIGGGQRVEDKNAGTDADGQRVEEVNAGIDGNSQRMEGENADIDGGGQKMEGEHAGIDADGLRAEGKNAGIGGGSQRVEGEKAGVVAGDQREEGDDAGIDGGGKRMEGESAGIDEGGEQVENDDAGKDENDLEMEDVGKNEGEDQLDLEGERSQGEEQVTGNDSETEAKVKIIDSSLVDEEMIKIDTPLDRSESICVDVLNDEKQIKTAVLTRIRRKLHRWFRILKERLQQPQINRLTLYIFGSEDAVLKECERAKNVDTFVIHPYSTLRSYYVMYVLALTFANLIITPLGITFFDKDQGLKTIAWRMFSFVSDILYLVDIIINFRVGFFCEDREVVNLNPKEIAMRYVKTWLVIDLAAAFPLDSILFLITATDVNLEPIQLILRTFSVCFLILIICHWNGCIQFFIPMIQGFPEDSWVAKANLTKAWWADQYSAGVFRAISHTLGNSYGTGGLPTELTEVAVTVVSMISGALMHTIMVANVADMVLNADVPGRMYREKVCEI